VDGAHGDLRVFNAQGQIFWTGKAEGATFVSAAEWPAGMYVIKLQGSIGRWIKSHGL
jgi:hypothetical protein